MNTKMYYFVMDSQSNACIEVCENKPVAEQEALGLNAMGFSCHVQDVVGVA